MLYKIIKGTRESIEDQVNEYLRDGYELHGSIIYVDMGSKFMLFQPMIKKLKITDESCVEITYKEIMELHGAVVQALHQTSTENLDKLDSIFNSYFAKITDEKAYSTIVNLVDLVR